LDQLGNFPNLDPWLTRDQAMLEILRRAWSQALMSRIAAASADRKDGLIRPEEK
jgi:hypothetical protein